MTVKKYEESHQITWKQNYGSWLKSILEHTQGVYKAGKQRVCEKLINGENTPAKTKKIIKSQFCTTLAQLKKQPFSRILLRFQSAPKLFCGGAHV